ncbi:MAG: class I SAM-dependent methyltransferase, partial [Candidatus Tectomicrobia bacterium]|nr:class I SAM-dependent methyltransferase [Candidatus Tectomicrobia bacterium]
MPESQPTSEWTGWRGRIGARYLGGPMRKLEDRWFLGSQVFLGGVFAVLRGGETVLDVGTGSGYCRLEIAERLGTGEVICLDLSDEMLAHLETRARRRGLRERIRILKADACSSSLGEGSVDLAVSVGVFHELPRPDLALAEMRRVLKPGGWAMMLDFRNTWFGRL